MVGLLSWIPLLFLLVLAWVFAFRIYYRNELPVAGRRFLALGRGLAISLVLLLIWNPPLPGGTGAGGAGRAAVLLDASLSMAARPLDRESAWTRAVGRVREMTDPDDAVFLFGDAVTTTASGGLAELAPTATASRLLPALRAATESGAREVTVVTDGRLTDAAFGALPAMPAVALRLEQVESGAANAGIADFLLPARTGEGTAFEAEVAVFGDVPTPPGRPSVTASARVEVREEERLVASVSVSIPAPGRILRTVVPLPPPSATGQVRYTAAALLDGDGFPDDDERVGYLEVAPEPAGVVLLSLRPDWEPRYLLPVLEDVTGLPVRGYLRVAGPRYLPMGRGDDTAGAVTEQALADLLREAAIAVVHGLDAQAPARVLDAVRTARRALIFPGDRAGASLAGVEVAGPVQGEWYLADAQPASPLAGGFAGLDLSVLPPFTTLRPVTRTPPFAAVQVQLDARGPVEPALVLATDAAGHRIGVALASGYWRWAARSGTPRRAYRSLWAGVANWLFAGDPPRVPARLGPSAPLFARGEPVHWEAPGLAGRTLALRIMRAGEVVLDSVVAVDSTETFAILSPGPGMYDFVISPVAEAASASAPESVAGRFDVERYTDDLRPAPVNEIRTAGVAGTGGRAGEGRFLRTHPVPFLLVLAILCGEWIGRRRKGLR